MTCSVRIYKCVYSYHVSIDGPYVNLKSVKCACMHACDVQEHLLRKSCMNEEFSDNVIMFFRANRHQADSVIQAWTVNSHQSSSFFFIFKWIFIESEQCVGSICRAELNCSIYL